MKHAFSLVELSIVLVILGLLTGGVLTGQSLIRAAELRSITTDYSSFQTAVMSFRDRYFAIPGDMPNATDFWGIRAGSGSTTGSDETCMAKREEYEGTCNGNQDGWISPNSTEWPTYPIGERFLFWQHLSKAGLINGNFTGAYNTGSPTESLENSPAGKLSGSFWTVTGNTYNPAQYSFTGAKVGTNVFYLRTFGDAYKVLTPEEAWNIDKKIDDGKPGTGTAYTNRPGWTAMPNCATNDDAATAEYNLSYSSNACSLLLKF